ncbi:hypothetical protein FF2_000013 [Malus domestica]
MYKSSANSSLDSKGGDVRFQVLEGFLHSSSHLPRCALFMALKKGLHRSVDGERKRFKAAARPVKALDLLQGSGRFHL